MPQSDGAVATLTWIKPPPGAMLPAPSFRAQHPKFPLPPLAFPLCMLLPHLPPGFPLL